MGWCVINIMLGDGRMDGWMGDTPFTAMTTRAHAVLTNVISGTLHYWRYLDRPSNLVLPIHAHCVLRRSFTSWPGFSAVAVLYKRSAPKNGFCLGNFPMVLPCMLKLESLLGQNAKKNQHHTSDITSWWKSPILLFWMALLLGKSCQGESKWLLHSSTEPRWEDRHGNCH